MTSAATPVFFSFLCLNRNQTTPTFTHSPQTHTQREIYIIKHNPKNTMCGHVSTSVVVDDTCPCFIYSDDILAPPLPQDLRHHQFLPPPPLMMSHHSLFGAEAVSGFGYFDSGMSGGGASSSCDSPSSMGSGGESLMMQRSVSSHNGFYGNFATTAHDFVSDHDGPERRALSAGDPPVSNIIYTHLHDGMYIQTDYTRKHQTETELLR